MKDIDEQNIEYPIEAKFNNFYELRLTKEGKFNSDNNNQPFDIVGLWEE